MISELYYVGRLCDQIELLQYNISCHMEQVSRSSRKMY